MLLYYLFWMLMGLFLHFYIIFGTNLLTRGPTQIAVFCLFQCFIEKECQTESKRNETFGNVIFSLNMIQETWTPRQESHEAATRVEGALPRARPLPRGPLEAPPTYSFLLYISMYPQTIRYGAKTRIPPAVTFCIHEIPSWGLFRSSAGGGPSSRRASTSS